jgi:hypothetical protein
MLCKCFQEHHPWGWRFQAFKDECLEWAKSPSWDEAQDVAWGIWSLADPCHRNRLAQWGARHFTPSKYGKHAARVEQWGCMRSKNHPHCTGS